MPLTARYTGIGSLALAAGGVTLEPNEPVDVTAEFSDLENGDFTALEAQRGSYAAYLTYNWTSSPEYDTGSLVVGQAGGAVAAGATDVGVGGGSGSVVVLRPWSDPGSGYVTEWSQAVAAVQAMPPGNTIFIDVDPWDPDNNGPYTIPVGVWDLNDTMLEGRTTYCHGGLDWQSMPPDGNHGTPWNGSADPFRGMQILTPVYTTGYRDNSEAYNHPTRINGCRGLKSLFFRGESWASNPSGVGDLSKSGTTITVTRTAGHLFSKVDASLMPSSITLSGTSNGNDGTFDVTSYDPNTGKITYENAGGADETGVGWALNRCNAVFLNNETFGRYGDFILDCADLRQGGSEWGALYVGENGRSFIKVRNAASIRMGSIKCDGHAVVQGDGTPCRVGSFAFHGDGWVKFYLTAGMEFRDAQCITYDVYQCTHWYTPADDTKWNGTIRTVHEALDQAASRVKTLEGYARTNMFRITGAGTQNFNPGAYPNNVLIVGDTNAAGDSITTALGDGAFDGQQAILIMGPMAADKTWTITPDHLMILMGSSFIFAHLADTVTLTWYSVQGAWVMTANGGSPSMS